MTDIKKQTVAEERSELRKFGLVMLCGFGVLGLIMLLRHKPHYVCFLGTGGVFGLLGLAAPLSLRYVFRFWMKLAHVLGTVNTTILLTVFYFIAITPTGLVMRLAGKDPMGKKWPPKGDSFWVKADEQDEDMKKHFERQF